MNNSKIAIDNIEGEEDKKLSFLQTQLGEITQVVEAINRVEASDDWQKLKKLLFDGIVENLERQLASEAKKKEVNPAEIYRLQGQLAWARKYVDLEKLSDFFKQQITNLKNQIKNEKDPGDGAP